jgi:hypothetical protein
MLVNQGVDAVCYKPLNIANLVGVFRGRSGHGRLAVKIQKCAETHESREIAQCSVRRMPSIRPNAGSLLPERRLLTSNQSQALVHFARAEPRCDVKLATQLRRIAFVELPR